MKNVEVEITGIAAMLHNRFDAGLHGENKSKSKQKVYVAVDEAEKLAYRNEDGFLYQPSEHILGALIKAAANFTFEGKKSFKDVIKAGVIVEPERMPLLDDGGKQRKTWDEIDARGVVVQRARVVRWRPRFNKWKIQFGLQIINDDQLSPETLKEILDYAGRIGIGDYRPRFGRFQVTLWKVINGEIKNGSLPTQQT